MGFPNVSSWYILQVFSKYISIAFRMVYKETGMKWIAYIQSGSLDRGIQRFSTTLKAL